MLTKMCERCDGDGEIHIVRDARIEELSDAQVKTLLHADMYRESGGEEAQEKQKQQSRKMKRRGAGGPRDRGDIQARPTNKTGQRALSNDF